MLMSAVVLPEAFAKRHFDDPAYHLNTEVLLRGMTTTVSSWSMLAGGFTISYATTWNSLLVQRRARRPILCSRSC